jgi:anti-sigma regulatory factor (Ser/Thr protein kinase)
MSTTAHDVLDVTLHLPCDTGSVRDSRREVARLLRTAGWAPLDVERAQLAVTELVANAVVHAHSEVTVRCRANGRVRLDVTDAAADAVPVPQEAAPDRLGGRGLQLVAGMSERWGVERAPGAKTVWCEMAPRAETLAETG